MDLPTLDSLGRISQLLLGGLVLGASYYIFLLSRKHQARKALILHHGCKPPSKYPVWDPFFGIDVIYDAVRAAKRNTFLTEKISHYNTYGNTHSSRLTTYPVISTIEPENIKAVMSTHFKDFVIGSPRRRAFGPIIAYSVLVADGVEWEHARAFLRPSFARSQVGDLATLETHVKNLIDAVPADGSTVDLAELLFRFTADVTTDFMFGESIESQRHPESFGGDLTEACRIGQLGAEFRFRLGIFVDLVPQSKFYRAVGKVHKYMEAHVDKAIRRHHAESQDTTSEKTNSGKHIFLNELVKLTDDRLVLRDQLLGIFMAGRDTTAALLTNLFFVLARNPKAWQRLQTEIKSLNGNKPTMDGLKGLEYLSACLNESKYTVVDQVQSLIKTDVYLALRLYPIVQGTSRVATKDVILPTGGGEDGKSPIFVRAGTLVVFHYVALHVRKDLWGEDAADFRPERWRDERAPWVSKSSSYSLFNTSATDTTVIELSAFWWRTAKLHRA